MCLRPRSFFDLGPRSLRFCHPSTFLNISETTSQISCRTSMGWGEQKWVQTILVTYILSRSSNQPLSFYQFSPKPQAIPQLHSQIGEYVSTPDHQKVYHNSVNCIQEASMNTGTSIFKINKNLHRVLGKFKHFDPKRPLSCKKNVDFCIDLFLQSCALVMKWICSWKMAISKSNVSWNVSKCWILWILTRGPVVL